MSWTIRIPATMNQNDDDNLVTTDMLHLYNLLGTSMTVANFDIHVSARQSMKIPGLNGLSVWHPVTNTLEATKSGEEVIIPLHGCDGLSTDIWSMRRLHDYHKSICIHLIIKESDKKLLDGLDTELRERIVSLSWDR